MHLKKIILVISFIFCVSLIDICLAQGNKPVNNNQSNLFWQLAKGNFEKMCEAYQYKNKKEFMDFVSEDFYGNYDIFAEKIVTDFGLNDDIIINAVFDSWVESDKYILLQYHWKKSVVSRNSGAILKTQGNTELMFTKEDFPKLLDVKGDKLFGN